MCCSPTGVSGSACVLGQESTGTCCTADGVDLASDCGNSGIGGINPPRVVSNDGKYVDGNCSSNGMQLVTSDTTCNEAAVRLNLNTGQIRSYDSETQPRGCWLDASLNELYVNRKINTDVWSQQHCERTKRCICRVPERWSVTVGSCTYGGQVGGGDAEFDRETACTGRNEHQCENIPCCQWVGGTCSPHQSGSQNCRPNDDGRRCRRACNAMGNLRCNAYELVTGAGNLPFTDRCRFYRHESEPAHAPYQGDGVPGHLCWVRNSLTRFAHVPTGTCEDQGYTRLTTAAACLEGGTSLGFNYNDYVVEPVADDDRPYAPLSSNPRLPLLA